MLCISNKNLLMSCSVALTCLLCSLDKHKRDAGALQEKLHDSFHLHPLDNLCFIQQSPSKLLREIPQAVYLWRMSSRSAYWFRGQKEPPGHPYVPIFIVLKKALAKTYCPDTFVVLDFYSNASRASTASRILRQNLFFSRSKTWINNLQDFWVVLICLA